MKSIVLHRHHLFWPLLGLALATLASQMTRINLALAELFYDSQRQHWLGKDSWLANTVLHDWGRDLIAVVFLLALLIFILSFIKSSPLKKWRRITAYLALCIALSTSLVGLGKKFSQVDCPWDLQQFGGTQPYIHLFTPKPASSDGGHCFPGGHSSGAFSLYALYFIALLLFPRQAKKILIGVSVLGLVYAGDQWLRGAHFAIHDIWSAAIGWYVSLLLSLLFFAKHSPQTLLLPSGEPHLPLKLKR